MTMRFPPKSSFLCPFRSFVPFRGHALPLPSPNASSYSSGPSAATLATGADDPQRLELRVGGAVWPGGMGALPPMFDESCEARL